MPPAFRTHVAQWGAGDDVLLIHGASSDMGVFEPTVIPLLERELPADRPMTGRVMGFTDAASGGLGDAGGAGKRGGRRHRRAGAETARSLSRIPMAAQSALRLALDHADLIAGLVLIAPVAYAWPGGVSWHLHWSSNPIWSAGCSTAILTRPFVGAAARAGTVAAFAPSVLPPDYVEEAGVLRAVRPAAMRANAADVIALKSEVTAQQARYAEIHMPVAIMAGDGDSVVSPTIHSLCSWRRRFPMRGSISCGASDTCRTKPRPIG